MVEIKIFIMNIKSGIYLLLTCILVFSACSKDDNNIAPNTSVMISSDNGNMPTGGVLYVQYGDCTSGHDVSKIVDGDINTTLIVPHNNFWVIWKGTTNKCINRCRISTTNDSPEMNPKSWQLSASKDSINWDTIYTKKNFQFTENLKGIKETIDTTENETAYTYYKLSILDNNGASLTKIAEWSLDDVKISNGYDNIDDLMKYSSGSTYSSQTTMGTHYENKHVTTDSDRTWLSTASNEPSIPSSLSSLQLEYFNVTLYPYSTPKPADINQHSIGDCDGLSAMASMAYVAPDFVKSLIQKNTDGTFSVSMFDPQGKAVTVAVTSNFLADSSGNIAAVSGKDNVATWSTVLEKAIMKYETIYKVDSDIGGIGSENTTPLFTGNGNSFAFGSGTLTGTQIARVVEYSLTHGKFITGGFNKVVAVNGVNTVTGHGYAVMWPSSSGYACEMRNPWGVNSGQDASDDGVLSITLSGDVISTIDLRIIYPGKAGNTGVTKPYTIPSFAVSANNFRVDPKLMRTHK